MPSFLLSSTVLLRLQREESPEEEEYLEEYLKEYLEEEKHRQDKYQYMGIISYREGRK